MKKFFLIASIVILTSVVFYSCTKNTDEVLTEEQAVERLVASDNFIAFTSNFVSDFSALMQYHRSAAVLADKPGFLSHVKLAGNNESALAATYQLFSLNYETAIGLKNKIDNDLLKLLNQHRFLLKFSEDQLNHIIVNAIDKGIHSDNAKWLQTRKDFRLNLGTKWSDQSIATAGLKMISSNRAPAELSLDEIWGCLKSALGLGAGSILGLGGAIKLAEQGIQQVVITASKWIAERASWFGAAIAVIDFSVCVYTEAKD